MTPESGGFRQAQPAGESGGFRQAQPAGESGGFRQAQPAGESGGFRQAESVGAGIKPRRYGSWYVAEHRFRGMRAYLQTVILTGIGNPLVYLFAMGVGLATLVDENMGANGVEGVGYLQFVAPALLVMAAIMASTEEFTYPIMLGFKWNPTFFGMNAAPIAPGQIINGIVYSVIARLAVTCGIYYVFMLLFGAIPSPLGVVALPVAVLTGLAFGTPMMAYVATLTQDTGQIAALMRFVMLPLTLFSGTFFPLTTMPIYLQWIGWISPIWHGTELGRVLAYGSQEPWWLPVVHVAYLIALTAVGWAIARRVAARRLNK